MKFEGVTVALHNPREAAHLGIEVVYQDLALCDNLDIVQNMFLGREETELGTFDEGKMEREASETLRSLSVRTGRPTPSRSESAALSRQTRSSTNGCTTWLKVSVSPAGCPSPACTSLRTRPPTRLLQAATRSTRPSP